MTPDRVRPGIHADEPGVQREFTDRNIPSTAEWAQGVWDKFQHQPTGKRQDRKRAINGLRKELARAVSTPEGQPQHLVRIPLGLGEAFTTWVARSDPHNERSRLFLETVQEECNEFARKNWNEITDTELGQYVSATSHTTLAREPLEGVLRSYFTGPGTPEQRIDALRNFTSGVLDLIPDARALEFGTRVISFHTDILPAASATHVDFLAHSSCGVDDLPLLEKALHVGSIGEGLRTLVGRDKFDMDKVSDEIDASPAFAKKLDDLNIKIHRTMPHHRAKNLLTLLGRYLEAPDQTFDLSNTEGLDTIQTPPSDDPKRWLFDIAVATNDPLALKGNYLIGSRVRSIQVVERIKREGRNGYQIGELITIPVGEDMLIDLFAPESIDAEQRRLLIQSVLARFEQERNLAKSGIFVESDEHKLISHRVVMDSVAFGEQEVKYLARKSTAIERDSLHEIVELLSTGFPVPEIPEIQRTEEAIRKIQDDIKIYQRRFLNRRGIRVGFYNPKITERGYSHVDFQRGDEPGESKVKIYHEGKPYEIKLDKNFNFDLEGKNLIAPQFEESLHYYLLTILKEYFCKEALESSEGTIVDREGLVQSRIPHLRLLPPGQQSGLDKRRDYLDEQGGDLIAKSEERKVLLGTDRNTTYVKAVVKEEDESLEPITVHIDAV